MVRFFSGFALMLLLLLKVVKMVWLIFFSSPFSFSQVPLLKMSAVQVPQNLRRVQEQSDHFRRMMYSPSPCLRSFRISPLQMCSSSFSVNPFTWACSLLIQRQMTFEGLPSSFSRMSKEKRTFSWFSPLRAMRCCCAWLPSSKVLKSTITPELTCRSQETVSCSSFPRVFSRSVMSWRDWRMLMEGLDLLLASKEMREGAARKGSREAIRVSELYNILQNVRFRIQPSPKQLVPLGNGICLDQLRTISLPISKSDFFPICCLIISKIIQ